MTRRHAPTALLLAALLVQACGAEAPAGSGGGAQTADPAAQAELEQKLAAANEEVSRLTQENEEQARLVASYTTSLNEILDSLDAVSGKQHDIGEMTRSVESGQTSISYNIGDRIQEDLTEIDRQMTESRRKYEELLQETKRSNAAAQTSGIEETVAKLERLLDSKEQEIRDLHQQVADLEAESQELRNTVAAKQDEIEEKDRQVAQLEQEVHKALYIVGTKRTLKDLCREGVLDHGFLGVYRAGANVHSQARLRSRFREAELSVERISLGEGWRRAEIVSLHRKYPDLYAIRQIDGETILSLRDPYQFWQISKYLVVEAVR